MAQVTGLVLNGTPGKPNTYSAKDEAVVIEPTESVVGRDFHKDKGFHVWRKGVQ